MKQRIPRLRVPFVRMIHVLLVCAQLLVFFGLATTAVPCVAAPGSEQVFSEQAATTDNQAATTDNQAATTDNQAATTDNQAATAADNTIALQPALQPTTLLVAFGTSQKAALVAYEGIASAFAARQNPVAWAYTSSIIRAKMARQGQPMASIDEAMHGIAQQGVKRLTVQSLHMSAGEEFSEMEHTVLANMLRHPGRFSSVKVGRPLLESERDLAAVVDAVLQSFPSERKQDEAVVLMGHGQGQGRGDLVMAAANQAFNRRDPLVYVATVEGANTLDNILTELARTSVHRVWLQPFMVVAGEHARNDLAGTEADSWASRLKNLGFEVKINMKGLGEIKKIQDLFAVHAREAEEGKQDLAQR